MLINEFLIKNNNSKDSKKSFHKISMPTQRYMLEHFLSNQRDDESSKYYLDTLSYLTMKLGRMGLYIMTKDFKFRQLDSGEIRSGVNVVGVLPGHRWASPEDKICK